MVIRLCQGLYRYELGVDEAFTVVSNARIRGLSNKLRSSTMQGWLGMCVKSFMVSHMNKTLTTQHRNEPQTGQYSTSCRGRCRCRHVGVVVLCFVDMLCLWSLS